MMKIDFQLFGETAETTNNTQGTSETAMTENLEAKVNTQTQNGQAKTDTKNVPQKKEYSDAEVQRLIDSAVSKAFNGWERKKEEEVRRAGLSEAERSAEEIQSLKNTIAEKDRALTLQENKITLQSEMSKRNIPVELSAFLLSDDGDTMMENLEAFDKAYKTAINNEVEKRIPSSTPKVGSQNTQTVTKEQFDKMTYQQKNDMFNTNPELYNKLKK